MPKKNSRTQNNQQQKKKKKRRVDVVSVSFDTQNEEIISIQSHEDYSKKERISYYVQKDEYADIKQNIQRTIKFLKSPTDSPSSSSTKSSNSSSSSSSDSDAATANDTNIEEHCIRGLESLAEDYVGEHKRRIQRSSKSAVFRFQEDKRKADNKNKNEKEENEAVATLALAEIYKRCTAGCQDIARRWGHFDATDAGIVSTASLSSSSADTTSTLATSSVTTTAVLDDTAVDDLSGHDNAMSSISDDGDNADDDDDEKEETNDSDSLPVNNGESTNAFDSLPDVLFY